MNLDVINGLGLDEQAGHRLVWLPCKYHNSIVTTDIGYSRHMPKMGLFSLVSSVAQLTLLYSRTLSTSCFSTVEGGRIRSLY